MDKTRVTVYVGGQSFRLASDENESYIREISEFVNNKIAEVQREYPTLSTANCTLLAALNMSDEYHKLRADYDALESRISQLREMPKSVSTPVKRPFEKTPVTTK